MKPYRFNTLPAAEQARLRQWQFASGLATVICGVGMLLMTVIHAWWFHVYPHMWGWLVDAAISGLVIALGAGIARFSRECLTASLAVLMLFLVSQLMMWTAQHQVGSFFLLLVPALVLTVNYWTHRIWTTALAAQEADDLGD
jgi:hypothetical protein